MLEVNNKMNDNGKFFLINFSNDLSLVSISSSFGWVRQRGMKKKQRNCHQKYTTLPGDDGDDIDEDMRHDNYIAKH